MNRHHCLCPEPLVSPNPRDSGCGKCGRRLDSTWTSNDRTMAEFFDRLASRWPPGDEPPEFPIFRRHCLSRERAGRETFGLRFLSRNNPQEAREEAADLANYCAFDLLSSIRKGEELEEDEALTAAWHVFQAYCSLLQLERKHHGSP